MEDLDGGDGAMKGFTVKICPETHTFPNTEMAWEFVMKLEGLGIDFYLGIEEDFKPAG